MIVDYRIAAKHHAAEIARMRERFDVKYMWVYTLIVVPAFIYRMVVRTTIGGHWGYWMTNRSDLAQRMAEGENGIPGARRVRDLAQKRVDCGLVGYRAWVDFANECIAIAELRGDRREMGAG